MLFVLDHAYDFYSESLGEEGRRRQRGDQPARPATTMYQTQLKSLARATSQDLA